VDPRRESAPLGREPGDPEYVRGSSEVTILARLLTDLSEAAVIAANEESCVQFWLHYGRGPGCEVHEEPDLAWFTTGIPFALLNGVMRARLAPEDVDGRIEDMVAEFRRRGVPLEWNVGTSTMPRDLGRHLERHGFEHAFSLPGMAIDLKTLPGDEGPPPGFTIAPVTSRRDLETYVRVGASAFDVPEAYLPRLVEIEAGMGPDVADLTTCYLGRLDGRPVATSMLFLAAGVAGIYFVGTAPEARGRGIGEAMTRWALREARELGYRVGILQASTKGDPIYRRIGFREYFRIEIYEEAGGMSPRPVNEAR